MKKDQTLGIVGGIIAVIIISVIFVQLFLADESPDVEDKIILTNETDKINNIDQEMLPRNKTVYTVPPRDWQVSGPFEIDRTQYALGEKIFLRVGALEPAEKGQVTFLRPLNDTHQKVYFTIPFDSSKPSFNQFFQPSVAKVKGICSKDDLIGNWTVVFQGTNYANIKFEIINLIVPGDEESYNKVVC
jgi:hypothetical protein